jgi:hypothetical protein
VPEVNQTLPHGHSQEVYLASIRERFTDDAARTAGLQQKWEVKHADGSADDVLGRLHFAFEQNAKYLSFYIPTSPSHPGYPENFLFRQIDELLKIPSETIGVSTVIDGHAVHVADLVFTGRVFVYSEQPFKAAAQKQLETDAAVRGLRLIFRSTGTIG